VAHDAAVVEARDAQGSALITVSTMAVLVRTIAKCAAKKRSHEEELEEVPARSGFDGNLLNAPGEAASVARDGNARRLNWR